MCEISHITLIVDNLDKTAAMLKTIFAAEEIYDSGQEMYSLYREKFFLIGSLWVAVMENGEVELPKTYNHIAFKIAFEELNDYQKRIEAAGLKIEEGRSRVTGEGASLYFYDFDNHLFELHTGTLEERLSRYKNNA